MRQGRSSKQETDQVMEIDDLSKLKEEPHHLSGAYIRSLVKQLTSSRTKDTMNPKDLLDCGTKFGEGFSETQNTPQPQQQQPQQQHKKQVRRRLHTSRPYQERLLNMAEARREIVTALKFHRAAMKQATEQQQQQQHQEPEQQPQLQQLQPHSHQCSEQGGRIQSRRTPRIYPSSTATYLETLPHSSNFPHQYPSIPYQFPSFIPPPPVYENFDFTALPSQTLGLNLNFQDFNNINTTLYHNSNSPSFHSSSTSGSGSGSVSASASSPSLSSSPSPYASTDHELPSSSTTISHMEMEAPADDSGITTSGGGDGLHAAMDDEEMAEIRSIGEQHQMEWNDTMNLVTSAWWLKFLKTEDDDDDDGYHLPFDEVIEFPAWLNASEGSFQQHLNDYYSADYFQDPALPCMDIGEFEGFDGEWLA